MRQFFSFETPINFSYTLQHHFPEDSTHLIHSLTGLFANSDDTLLEGDIGDDVDYDLGNEDEDALLADDYDVQVSISMQVLLENLK